MKLRVVSVSSLCVVGLMVLSLAAGCGLKRNPASPTIEPADVSPSPAASAPIATSSAAPSPSPSSNPTPVVPGELTVKDPIITISGLMFTRHVKAAVEVSNPTDGALSGTVTCIFGAGSSSDQIQTQNVSLNAHEVRILNFDEKAWLDKTAKAEVSTTHPAAANRLR